MTEKRTTLLVLLLSGIAFVSVLILFCPVSHADDNIYTWVDDRGTRHFSNSPDHKDARIYIKAKRTGVARRGSGSKSRSYARRSTRFTDRDTYDNIIKEAAEVYGLEFALVKAVIKVESNFNPRARSPKGARGLMQVMPFNFNRLGIYDPYDPRDSIMGGSKYLSEMLSIYDGDLDLALAAYNAGPGTVDSCGRRVPSIPETRSYVSRVKDAYNYYVARQTDSDAAVFRADGSPVAGSTMADVRAYR